MEETLHTRAAPAPGMALDCARSRAEQYLRAARAPSTRRAYAADWRHFSSWCRAHGRESLPAAPESLVMYLSACAETARTSTVTRRLCAISQAHQTAGFDSPAAHLLVRKLMSGIRRQKGTAQHGKRPLLTRDIHAMLAPLRADKALDVRDRALILLGFAGAFRRSELAGMDLEDVEIGSEGLIVKLRRSKTDQEGQGRKVGIPRGGGAGTCPVHAVETWMKLLPPDRGPLFRSINRHGRIHGRLTAQSVSLVVKRLAGSAGLIPAEYAAHSLRAGLATAAAAAGVSERAIMAQTGHRSLSTVRRYIREGSLFRENAAAKLGL